MRPVSRLICLLCVCSMSLWACTGTEVGNGARPKNPDETRFPDGGSGGSGGIETSSGDGPSPDGGTASGTDSSNQILAMAEMLPYLLAPCASPLVEAGVSTFKTKFGDTLAIVDQAPNWRVDVSQNVLVYSGLVKSASTSSAPYALMMVDTQNLPVASKYSCSSPTNQTTPDVGGDITQRGLTVTTERGTALVKWAWFQPSTGSGRVTSIQVDVGEKSATLIGMSMMDEFK